MKNLFPVVVLALSLWMPAAAVAMDAEPDPAAEETIISTEICSRLWIVKLVWRPEGREPRELVGVFDTGASHAFIDPDALERISGQRVAEGKRAKMEDMTVAGRRFHTFKPKVKDLDHLSRALGLELDVFLPFQTFDSFLLILDYPAGEMRIRQGELPKPDGISVFDARGRDDRPWLEVPIGPVKRRLLIDSGSSGSIAIHPNKKLEWLADPVPLKVFQGMYDIEMMKVGRLDGEAEVGPLTLAEPHVGLTEDTELLGARIMRHFVLTFDQKRRRVRLDPATPGPVVADPLRGTGAVLQSGKYAYEIAYVIEGSPAAGAGLRPGDWVTHIDGIHVLERGCRGFDDKKEATTTLTVERDGAARDVTLENVVLIR